MPSRRRFLTLALAATATTITGCITEPPASGTTVNTTVSSLDNGDRRRAGAPSISVEQNLLLNENLEYIEANETIRYPVRSTGDETDSYGTIGVDEWMALEAMSITKQAILNYLETQLPSTTWLGTHGTARGGPETEIEVTHMTYKVPNGPDDEPAVSAAKLVTVTPRAVDVTVHFTGRTVIRTYPVFVVKWVGRHLEGRTTG